VRVTIQVLDSRPSGAGIGDLWSEIVELDFRVVSGEVFVTNWDGLPVQSLLLESGNWRLRVHARGRDEGAAREWSGTEDPVEEHLLQLFGGPLLGETAILTRDHYGQVLRAGTTPEPPTPQLPPPTIDEVLRNVLPNLPGRRLAVDGSRGRSPYAPRSECPAGAWESRSVP
jgi:hypothetical protein